MPMMSHISRLKTMRIEEWKVAEFNYWESVRDILIRQRV